jgi:hypothetical protein
MITTLILANAFTDSLAHIVGFLSVLATLTILWLITAAMGRYFAGADKRGVARAAKAAKASAPEVSGAAPAVKDAGDKTVSDEMIAAISAAAYMLLGGKHRIVSIRSISSDWSREGRRQHFASHKIR